MGFDQYLKTKREEYHLNSSQIKKDPSEKKKASKGKRLKEQEVPEMSDNTDEDSKIKALQISRSLKRDFIDSSIQSKTNLSKTEHNTTLGNLRGSRVP